MEPVRLLNLIHAREERCDEVEHLAVHLVEIALRGGHAARAELLREVNDSCRFVMQMDFTSEEQLAAYFSDPERIATLKQVPDAVRQEVQRFELTPVTVRATGT